MAANRSAQASVEEVFAQQILSYELYPYFKSLFSLLSLVFSLPSVCFNAINVFIFCKIGATDSITVCFLHLAICDFCTMVSLSVGSFFKLLFSLGAPGSENLSLYTFATATVHGLFSDVGSATTTYIALQRGLCVAWPFLTRHAFTRNRSLAVLTAITVILWGSGMPRAVSFRFVQGPGQSNNSSQMFIIHFLQLYDSFDALYLTFVKIIMGFTQYIVMSICAVAISIGMRSSMKLKSAASSAASNSCNSSSDHETLGNDERHGEPIGQIHRVETDNNIKQSRQIHTEKTVCTVTLTRSNKEMVKKPPQKELLVIKQVLAVVLLQVICTTPGIIVYIYAMVEPKYQLGTEYHNLLYVVYSAVDGCHAINAFFNFFIYVQFNARFKSCFDSMFYCGNNCAV
ncbi:chemosensory receptor c [Plakobranchus ocellatus]|uniref:Chemosensory receptor c n=1 Tax=Plakobranchus ocellatus TaxID=259542 RepID=A0AAV4BCP6_9GAST|nr:chemosensory receptor c [Plakobranchus ocellatus]